MATMLKIIVATILLAPLATLVACEDNNKRIMHMIEKDALRAEDWQILGQRRIVFGHQSVGTNMLSGVAELAKQSGVNLPVTVLQNTTVTPGISHFKIGQNDDPYSKTKDFERAFDSGMAKDADIALMKLCYIDFKNNTDAMKLASDYSESLERLRKKYPNTIFIAVTTPLTTVQGGPKAVIKRLLGKTPSGYSENARRKEFNDYLRERYNKTGLLFDLAKLENNGAGPYTYKDRPIEVLNPALTDDGGHLNSAGQQYIAAAFLKFLTTVSLDKRQ
jgi:hypothetical protein